MEKYYTIADLVGRTIKEINNNDNRLTFTCEDGDMFMMHHSQDCCESVSIEDIIGDLDDLIGSPVLTASEDISSENPEGTVVEKDAYVPESFTWTFYNIATIKGHVTIRWYGESNGYYSESVDFVKC